MKRLFYFILFLTYVSLGSAQEHIPNGGFEDYTSCPTYYGMITNATGWIYPGTGYSGGSEFYHQCGWQGVGVPNNWGGFQNPKKGLGYGGVVIKEIPADWRTYIEIQLTYPLIADSCYHFEMYINLADVCRYTSSSVGAYFSNTLVSGLSNHLPLSFTPQISYSGSFIDTINWTSVSGDFIAAGGESYLIIGNFLDDLNSNFQTLDPNGQKICYFYIDEVSLQPCVTSTGIDEIKNTAINVFPNPVNDIVNISLTNNESYEILLFDASSRLLLKKEFENYISINISQLESGIYFYQLISENGAITKGKLMKE